MRILLIEDNRLLCEAVQAYLAQNGVDTDVCFDGEEGLFYLRQGIYDMCCLDRMLPGLDGLSLLRKARAEGIATPVLMLTALSRVGDRVEGLEAGADDYLAKPFDLRELLARVRALARRPAPLAEQRITFGNCVLDPAQLTLRGPAGVQQLTRRECDLLEALARSAGKLVARPVLLGRVWGADAEVEDGSLDSYIHFVRRRLAAVGSDGKLATVRGRGYRLEVPQ